MAIGETLESYPGSYKDFVEKHGLEYGQEALNRHSEAVDVFRTDLAALRGFDSVDEMHRAPLDFDPRAAHLGGAALIEIAS